MKMNTVEYVVKFGDAGYYAAKQPNYNWAFTANVEEAARYKTEQGAKSRVNHAMMTEAYKMLNATIIPISVSTEIKDQ